jgi:anti-anti-sigma factor
MIITAEVTPLMERLGRDMVSLVLDLSDVKAMSSFGLGLCIELRNAANSVGASTAIVGMSSDLRDLFKMMKVDRLYTIAEPRHQPASAIA